MARALLPLIVMAFAMAAFVTLQVNRLPRFALTPALQAELATLLRQNDLALVPMDNPPGMLIDAALRFRAPACAADGFVLPQPDTTLTAVQAVRFAEIGGTDYVSYPMRLTSSQSILAARMARAKAAFQQVLGLPAPRNGHTVLAVFLPEGCTAPLPDLRAFWAPAQVTG